MLFDPRGDTPKDVLMGGIIGLVTNVLPMSGKLRDKYDPKDKSDYNYGLQAADAAAAIVGAVMIISGEGGQTAGGGLLAIGAGVSATGVGAPEGGAVAIGGAIAIAGGLASEVGGLMILANTADNVKSGYERGKDSQGTQTASTTLWKSKGKAGATTRIDVENNGRGEGQIHLHLNRNKFVYNEGSFYSKNPKTG